MFSVPHLIVFVLRGLPACYYKYKGRRMGRTGCIGNQKGNVKGGRPF